MGFWEGLKDVGKAALHVGAGIGEADRILGLHETVARRQVELAARNHDDMAWRALVVGLDHFAREGHSAKAVLAAELASYADSLRAR